MPVLTIVVDTLQKNDYNILVSTMVVFGLIITILFVKWFTERYR